MMAKNLEQPGPYDAPIHSADFDKDAPHYLTFELKGPIDDLAAMNLFGGGGEVTELRALTERLHKAPRRPNVRGLVLRFDDPQLDMASAEELRAALSTSRPTEQGRVQAAVPHRWRLEHRLLRDERLRSHRPPAARRDRADRTAGDPDPPQGPARQASAWSPTSCTSARSRAPPSR
jgi:hypothetical protein